MADPEDSRARVKRDLGGRLRQVRMEFYGEHGEAVLARSLGLPHRTWLNYEKGVTIPGDILLALLDLTCVEPRWLLRGEGTKYRRPDPEAAGQWGGQPAGRV